MWYLVEINGWRKAEITPGYGLILTDLLLEHFTLSCSALSNASQASAVTLSLSLKPFTSNRSLSLILESASNSCIEYGETRRSQTPRVNSKPKRTSMLEEVLSFLPLIFLFLIRQPFSLIYWLLVYTLCFLSVL